MPVILPKKMMVFFDLNSHEIRRDQLAVLDSVQSLLRSAEIQNVKAVGHADSIGPEAYNEMLSTKRAQAVKTYLLRNSAVSSTAITILGMGEKEPIQSNDDSEGRAFNRRVEILFGGRK